MCLVKGTVERASLILVQQCLFGFFIIGAAVVRRYVILLADCQITKL